MVEPEQKSNFLYKDRCTSTKNNVMHLVEQRGCALLQIAFPRCIHHCWHLLPTTETSCRCNPNKNDQQDCVKWCYSMMTLLTWHKTLYRSWVGKSFQTHLIHLILNPRFSPFLCSIKQPSRNFLSRWNCAPNMAWRLQLKTMQFLQARNWKITPLLADCCK